jgi:HTH-type transcriptional regulator / antitoxin HigA
MEIKPIRSEDDHDEVLREIERLWGATSGTPESDKLEVLLTLAEAWEEKHHAVPLPDPASAIRFRLEQLGLDQRALIDVIGSRSRVHEVMKGDRPLTLNMIRRLVSTFNIPAEVLIQESHPRQAG